MAERPIWAEKLQADNSIYGLCGLPLIYSPCWLKLPVLAASTSLRRSRQAGAARMDAG
jgi:hypothetical protein